MKTVTKKEYLKAAKEEKGRILDAVCEVTDHKRKSAIRRFRSLQLKDKSIPEKRGRNRIYTNTVTAALKEVWDTAHQICAERLHPLLAEYVTVLKRDRMWNYDDQTTALLLRMSLSTVKRRIEKMEKEGGRKGRGLTKPSILKEIIPIRRGPWENPEPGKAKYTP